MQTYRLCVGILGYKDKYGKKALEECCHRALEVNRPYYSYIKNTISAVSEELGITPSTSSKDTVIERGGIPRPSRASDINTLLSKSKSLLDKDNPDEAGSIDGEGVSKL